MEPIKFIDNVVLDPDKEVVFFRLPVWARADLSRALLNDVFVNKSKIKKFESWLRDMRRKDKAKFSSKKGT